MNLWVKANTRWTKEQIAPWSSVYKTAYLIFPVIIYYFAGDVTEICLWFILDSLSKRMSPNTIRILTEYSPTVKGIIYAIGLVVSICILEASALNEIKYVEDHKEKDNKLTPFVWCRIVIASLGLAVFLNYLFMYLGITSLSSTYDSVSRSQYGVTFISGLMIYGIISPLVEEIIFRGIIFNRLKRIFPITISFIVGALLFGIFHGNIVQGIYGTIMGLFIIWVYDRYETILAPIVVHVVANVGVYVLNYTVWK